MNLAKSGSARGAALNMQHQVLNDLLYARSSCRAFLQQPVPRSTIVAVLETAQRTASWCNTQPWQLIVTSGTATTRLQNALYQHAANDATDGAIPQSDLPWPREYRGIYLERRRETGFQLHEAIGIARGDKSARKQQLLENYRMFGAPHVAIVTTDDALGVYGAIDCGAFVSNFLLAAQASGLGAIAQAALARYSPFLRQHFNLSNDRLIVCGIAFGFADRAHKANDFRTSRARLEDVVFWAGEHD